MTTGSDKAKSKLLESMRISKGGVSKAPAARHSAEAAPEKKAATRSKPATNKATNPASKSTPIESRTRSPSRPTGFSGYSSRSGIGVNDPYQGRARIWPD